MITIRINQVNIQSSALVNAQRPDHLTIGNYSFCESAMSDRKVPNRVGVCAVFHASLEKERELRAGLKRGEFSMLGQPRVDALNGTVLSVEALVRWEHPSKGLLSPPEFIDLAEETGLVVGLGKLIIEQVYAHITESEESGVNAAPLLFNELWNLRTFRRRGRSEVITN